MPKSVLKTVKVKTCVTKIQFAIWSCSGACQLVMRPASGFDSPRVQIEPQPREQTADNFCWDLAAQSDANHLDGSQDFLQMRFLLSGQVCPTLTVDCLAGSTTCRGSSRLHGLLGFVIVQSHKDRHSFGRNFAFIVSDIDFTDST